VTRFEILDLPRQIEQRRPISPYMIYMISKSEDRWVSLAEIARASRSPHRRARWFRSNLRTQLELLHRYGVVKKKLVKWTYADHRDFRHYSYRISQRGRGRLRRAQVEGQTKVESFRAIPTLRA